MFQYARSLLAKCERTRSMFIEAYIRVRLSNFKSQMDGHLDNNKYFIRKWARNMFNSKNDTYAAYCKARTKNILMKKSIHRAKCNIRHQESSLLDKMKEATWPLHFGNRGEGWHCYLQNHITFEDFFFPSQRRILDTYIF